MSAYFLFDNKEVIDATKLEEYKRAVKPIVERYGGRYVVLGGPVGVFEGTPSLEYPVMIEFPTVELAKRWYTSDAYRPLKQLRHTAVKASAVLVEGVS